MKVYSYILGLLASFAVFGVFEGASKHFLRGQGYAVSKVDVVHGGSIIPLENPPAEARGRSKCLAAVRSGKNQTNYSGTMSPDLVLPTPSLRRAARLRFLTPSFSAATIWSMMSINSSRCW